MQKPTNKHSWRWFIGLYLLGIIFVLVIAELGHLLVKFFA
jgi:hypothetical protein